MNVRSQVPVYFATVLVALPGGAYAQRAPWGVLNEIAVREWVTDSEPRPRVSRFEWQDQGRVLIARHGFVARLQFGEARFADTLQRFELNQKTGLINVTYTYEDGRPPLNTLISIAPDGSAVETFKQADGVEFRNTYRSPSLSTNTILRERKEGAAWVTLGTTRKTGLTRLEIAEKARRAEEARQMAQAQAQAQEAERLAQLAAEEADHAAYQADQAARQQSAQNGPNMLDVLNGIGASIQRDTQQRQAQFDRQLQQAVQDQARQKAEAARAEAQRIAAESARRVQEANARQAAISQQYAQSRADTAAQAGAAQAQAEADRARRAQLQQRQDAERSRLAEEQRQAAAAEQQRQREAQAQAADAERRRQADARAREQARLLAERNAPVDWAESVTLCIKEGEQAKFGNWRCTGSLQMNYVNFEKPNWEQALDLTCGGPTRKRDLGMVNGYRAFGCNFGLPPGDAGDIPRRFGIGYVPGRITYRCPRSASSCQSR